MHLTDSTKTSRQYEFHTAGGELDAVINCYDVKYSNERRRGTLLDLKNNKIHPISCIFNISTRGSRNFAVYNPEYRAQDTSIFNLNFYHDVGR